MTKRRVIIADLDLSYLLTLQIKLLEDIKVGTVIEAISSKDYFDSFFSMPQDANCLIVSEELFYPDLVKHNIENIVVLAEDAHINNVDHETVNVIYKYSSLTEIFNQLKSILFDIAGDQIIRKKDTQVITLFSPSGGQGCTVLSLCLARYLENQHYNVLYISTQSIQNFQFYLEDSDYLSPSTMMELDMRSGSYYGIIRKSIRKNEFSYIPQLPAPLTFFGIKKAMFVTLIGEISASNDYDFIIVDTDSVFDSNTGELMKSSDKVCFVIGQNEVSLYTADTFLPNIDRKPGQFVFVSNKTSVDKKMGASLASGIAFDISVPLCEGSDRSLLDALEMTGSIAKLGLLMDLT